MSDQPDLPALSDDELRETLDRLASLALNLSDQVEDQTKAINRATTAANEARRAAVTVQSQNDPAGFGDRIGQAVEARLLDTLQRLDRTVNHLDLRTKRLPSSIRPARIAATFSAISGTGKKGWSAGNPTGPGSVWVRSFWLWR